MAFDTAQLSSRPSRSMSAGESESLTAFLLMN
jgi:hypothetical protein